MADDSSRAHGLNLEHARGPAPSRAAETRRRNRVRQLERILTRSAREDDAVAVHPSLFVQAMFPHREVYALGPLGEPILLPTGRRAPDGSPETTRALAAHYQATNGDLTLTIRAGLHRGAVSRGIPYGGLARLLLAYVLTEAKKTRSQTVDLGRTLSAFCKRVAITPSGGRRGRLTYVVDQLQRLATCAITYEWRKRPGYGAAPRNLRGENLFLAGTYHFWHRDASPGCKPTTGGSIRLGDDFWRDVARSCFPLDLRKAQLFRAYPTAYDLYLWLTFRLAKLERDGEPGVALSLDQLHAQLGSHYATRPDGRLTPDAKKEFGRSVRKALRRVHAAWPTLHVDTPRGRVVLHATGPDVRQR